MKIGVSMFELYGGVLIVCIMNQLHHFCFGKFNCIYFKIISNLFVDREEKLVQNIY